MNNIKKRPDPIAEEPMCDNSALYTERQLTFDEWWLRASAVRKFDPSLKAVLRAHFISAGYWENNEWEAGLKNFGLS